MEKKKTKYIKSPLNYTGGKYKLLSQIIPLFPKDIDTFLEPFAGGLNVSLNLNANSYILNDSCKELVELWEYLSKVDIDIFIKEIEENIKKYDLSITNVAGYNKLREDRNKTKDNTLLFFLLICYGFNHQIRFNRYGEFNIPFGKERSCFNDTIKKNLILTIEQLQSYKDLQFTNIDFRKINYSKLTNRDFVYFDPPYYITTATYNDGWTSKEEQDLLDIMTILDKQCVKFALSNVIEHHGVINELLLKWSKNFNIIDLTMDYKNSSYHKKEKNKLSREVLITNY